MTCSVCVSGVAWVLANLCVGVSCGQQQHPREYLTVFLALKLLKSGSNSKSAISHDLFVSVIYSQMGVGSKTRHLLFLVRGSTLGKILNLAALLDTMRCSPSARWSSRASRSRARASSARRSCSSSCFCRSSLISWLWRKDSRMSSVWVMRACSIWLVTTKIKKNTDEGHAAPIPSEYHIVVLYQCNSVDPNLGISLFVWMQILMEVLDPILLCAHITDSRISNDPESFSLVK